MFFLILFALSGISSYITISEVQSWYKTLAKPSFNPPDWLFGPVWTILYAMIAVSGWLVWQKLSGSFLQKIKTKEMKIYAAQIAANFLWSILFFGLHQIFAALVDVLVLLGLIAMNIAAFKPISKIAAWLLVPYFCWVAFASTLNLCIYILN